MSAGHEREELLPANLNAAAILESISDGVFTVDSNWQITYFNRAAEAITGVSRQEALGQRCSEVFRASMCETDCALRQTLLSGEPVIDRTAFIINTAGERIPISVSTAILRDASGNTIGGAETFRDLSLVTELRKELEGRFQIGDLISRSPALRRIHELLPQLALSEAPILIGGETGTGKELLARALHSHSQRHAGPFVAVNCGALPDTLLESELFGHVKGAFTGAVSERAGRFALAEGGTLFLDEIGDVSAAMQVRLLRVLQEHSYEPLGSSRSVASDVRLIAASHRDLAQLVATGKFRDDLYYRLNVVELTLPPLRERREDIPLLVEHFIARFNRRLERRIAGIAPAALALLLAHNFPGNVRELENIIERAFVLTHEGLIGVAHLPPGIQSDQERPATSDSSIALQTGAAEAVAIRQALAECHYNRLAAAKRLGIHKSTLFRKIKRLGIELPAADGRSATGRK